MFSRRWRDPRCCCESVVLLRTHSVLDNEAALNCRQMELRGRFGARSPFQTQNNLPSPSLFKINGNIVRVSQCHNKKLLARLSGLIICRLKCYVGFVRCRCRLLCYRNHTRLRAAITGMFEIWNTKNRHRGFSFIPPPPRLLSKDENKKQTRRSEHLQRKLFSDVSGRFLKSE